MQDVGTLPDEALAGVRLAAQTWLSGGQPTVVAAAPGRLDVMGGIADYSGAMVLEGTIGALAVVALQRREDGRLRVRTAGPEISRLACSEFSLHLGDFYVGGHHGDASLATLKPYPAVQALFPPEARWAAYVLGVFYVLLAEGELFAFPGGADLVVHSAVPLGAGVASSAAIEVAAMRAVTAAFGAPTSGLRLALLCQIVENRVVGAPCGIMDQVTCVLGQAGKLLALRCRPHEVEGWHSAPSGFAFVGLDSGVKHAVGGRRYARVRCAAFMGRRIIHTQLAQDGEDPQRATYLCDLTPSEYQTRFRHLLPARLNGRAFLDRWKETGDTATTVDPDEVYPVRGATEHPIYENERVHRFLAALQRGKQAQPHGASGIAQGSKHVEGRVAELKSTRGPAPMAAMTAAGRLMYGSHRSYGRNCGLGSRETDLLVSLVRRHGVAGGMFGAKITGGGSGGTVAVLMEASPDGGAVDRSAVSLQRIAQAYEQQVGWQPRPISGSQPGAASIAPAHVRW